MEFLYSLTSSSNGSNTAAKMIDSSREKEGMESYRELIKYIRSADEDERRLAITKIPNLVLAHFERGSELNKQILLLIYNLNTHTELFENFTLSNGALIVRHLIRLYTDSARGEHMHEQVEALVNLVRHSNTSELLIELTNALYQCLRTKKLSKEDNDQIENAFNSVREKAAANMYPDALLMIYSIMAIK